MIVYNYNKLGEYIGESEARIDPLETVLLGKDIFLIPANATFEAPPVPVEGKKRMFLDGTWIYEDIIIEEKVVTWEEIRSQRDNLLRKTDWTQLADAPLITEQKEQYRTYRQALRDIPQNYKNLEEVIFPILEN